MKLPVAPLMTLSTVAGTGGAVSLARPELGALLLLAAPLLAVIVQLNILANRAAVPTYRHYTR